MGLFYSMSSLQLHCCCRAVGSSCRVVRPGIGVRCSAKCSANYYFFAHLGGSGGVPPQEDFHLLRCHFRGIYTERTPLTRMITSGNEVGEGQQILPYDQMLLHEVRIMDFLSPKKWSAMVGQTGPVPTAFLLALCWHSGHHMICVMCVNWNEL